MPPLLLLPVFLVAGVVAIPLANRRDRRAIRRGIADRGGRLVSIRWSALGRIYRVLWTDRRGAAHASICRSGVLTPLRWMGEASMSEAPRRHARG
jgi:hypothetical protein